MNKSENYKQTFFVPSSSSKLKEVAPMFRKKFKEHGFEVSHVECLNILSRAFFNKPFTEVDSLFKAGKFASGKEGSTLYPIGMDMAVAVCEQVVRDKEDLVNVVRDMMHYPASQMHSNSYIKTLMMPLSDLRFYSTKDRYNGSLIYKYCVNVAVDDMDASVSIRIGADYGTVRQRFQWAVHTDNDETYFPEVACLLHAGLPSQFPTEEVAEMYLEGGLRHTFDVHGEENPMPPWTIHMDDEELSEFESFLGRKDAWDDIGSMENGVSAVEQAEKEEMFVFFVKVGRVKPTAFQRDYFIKKTASMSSCPVSEEALSRMNDRVLFFICDEVLDRQVRFNVII